MRPGIGALLLVLGLAAAPAAELPRIAIGGGLRLGFGGILLRAGLPFDYLADREQCDLAVLSRYDLVLMSDLNERWEPWRLDALAALDQYVRQGGRLLTAAGNRLPTAMAGWRIRYHGPRWPPRTDRREFALLPPDRAPDDPFFTLLPAQRQWEFHGEIQEVDPQDRATATWARFVAGPAKGSPAVLHRRHGRGELVVLAANVSYMQGNWDPLYDDLVLAIVDRLSHGRARAQWAAEPAAPAATPLAGAEASGEPPEGFTALGDAAADGYAVQLPHQAELSLERQGQRELRLMVANGRLVLARAGATSEPLLDTKLPPSGQLVLYRGPRRVVVANDGELLATAELPAVPAGACSARSADQVLFQPLEPLWFADDFTRQGGLEPPWAIGRGTWLLGGTNRPESSVFGFALRGWDGAVRVGEWFWSDYEAAVTIRPRGAKQVRLRTARWDGGHYLELVLPVGHDGGHINQVTSRGVTQLARDLPGLPIQQWTRVSLAGSTAGAVATIGGRRWSVVRAAGQLGGIELVAEKGDALFDDVQVAARDADRSVRLHPPRYDKGPDGLLDRDTWSHPAAAWLPGRRRGEFQHVGRFNRGFSLRLPIRRGDGAAGLRVTATPEHGAASPLVELDNEALVDGQELRVDWSPGRARWSLAGRVTEVAAPAASVGLELAFDGLTLAAADLDLRAEEVQEWVFDHALHEAWETEGEWSVGARWPCMTQWSWLTGAGTPKAALWSRQAYRGRETALVVQAYLGVRMMGVYGEREGEPLERLRLTIAGDGHHPRSGYQVDLGGGPDGFSRLYRKDRVVATATRHLSYPREIHNSWMDLRVEWVRPTVRVWCQRRPLLEYTDPAPLEGGQICLSTDHNVLVTPYVAVYGNGSADRTALPAVQQKQRLEHFNNRLARPNFDPLRLLRTLARLLHREMYQP